MTLNKVTLIGRVGKDPEIRSMNNGNEVATFSLATSDNWKDKQTGEKKEKTQWHRIVVYNKGMVGSIKQYVRKGKQLYLEGKIETRKYTTKDGIEKSITEIILQGYGSAMIFLEKKSITEHVEANFDGTRRIETPKEAKEFIEDKIDDDIPF
jgi:single-strand DNA-binding protein